MITLSAIKTDVGGYVGHSSSHPEVLEKAQEYLERAKKDGLLVDFHVTRCGDDLQLIMTHEQGEENEQIHKLAWDTFVAGTEVAKKLKLYEGFYHEIFNEPGREQVFADMEAWLATHI